jgi:hypothetical protein
MDSRFFDKKADTKRKTLAFIYHAENEIKKEGIITKKEFESRGFTPRLFSLWL